MVVKLYERQPTNARKPARRLTAEEIAEIRRLRPEHTLEALSRKYGVSPQCIHNHTRDIAGPSGKMKSNRNSREAEIIAATGSLSEIAKRFGLSRARVHQIRSVPRKAMEQLSPSGG